MKSRRGPPQVGQGSTLGGGAGAVTGRFRAGAFEAWAALSNDGAITHVASRQINARGGRKILPLTSSTSFAVNGYTLPRMQSEDILFAASDACQRRDVNSSFDHMRIADLLKNGRPSFSFEFFPPKTEQGRETLLQSILDLRELKPTYVSVTYGAGGSTRDLTVELVSQIKRDHGMETMAHLTCVGSSRDDLRRVLDRLADAGIENVLALRGDPPRGETEFRTAAEGFSYACQLTEMIRESYTFCIAGACYPQKHIECASFDEDLVNLKQKVNAGSQFLITQLFFDNQAYFDFFKRARAAGISVPIIPGIMPITNVEQVERFTKLCGATIPEPLRSELDRVREKPDVVQSLGVAHATAQCLELLQKDAPGIHFYTLNKSLATRNILTAIRTVWPPAQNPA